MGGSWVYCHPDKKISTLPPQDEQSSTQQQGSNLDTHANSAFPHSFGGHRARIASSQRFTGTRRAPKSVTSCNSTLPFYQHLGLDPGAAQSNTNAATVLIDLTEGDSPPETTSQSLEHEDNSQDRKRKIPTLELNVEDEQGFSLTQSQPPKKKRRPSGVQADPQAAASVLVPEPPVVEKVRKASKLAEKKANIPGPTGANRRAKGITRIDANGQLEWRASDTDPWSKSMRLTGFCRPQRLISK
jgi:hypothetical protein